MSFQAMTWAVEQELPAMQKIVLLMLANRTNPETGACFPSHDTLAKECGMDRRSVIRQIEKLEAAGLLTVNRSTNKPNSYTLNFSSDTKSHCDTQSLQGVTESPFDSDTKSPETVIKPKRTITTTGDENFFELELTFDGLPPDQIECWNWAKNHDYWHFATESIHKFLTLYCKPKRDGLKAQFDAHKKALQDGRGQTGLHVQSQKNIGGNYATHYANNKKPTAAQIAKSLRERANAADNFVPVASNCDGYNGEFVADANAQILVCDD